MSQKMAARHILVIPFPAQGHLIPLLDLTHHLLSSHPNLTVTILITPKSQPLISSLLDLWPNSIETLILPLPSLPSHPSRAEHVRDLPSPSSVAALIHSLYLLRPQIVSWARSLPDPPTSILSDFFLGWTHRLAADLSIPRFAFYSSGALAVSVLDRLFSGWALSPPLPSFRYDHLPSIFRRYEAARGGPDSECWELVKDSMVSNPKAHAAVLNTFEGLESRYLDCLKESYGHDRVWAVGPISPALPGSVRGGRSSVPAEEIVAWLDTCPARSAVYVCFGSQFKLGGPHARALASALEASRARFVWCVGSADPSVPDDGFEERARGKGLVIRGWAPQVTVLAHPSVGSFVTHCGWNSVLEGIASGTVLLTWPMEADQFVNARLVVEEMGIGAAACEGGPDVVPEVEALVRVLEESVDGTKWVEVKRRADEMRRMAGEGRSSWEDMKKLGKELCEIHAMK